MYFKQFYLGCLAHASYLIGDEASGKAVVVDPQRDVEGYLEEARRQGLTIEHVLLTHFHADFVAGHLELRDRLGAKIWIGAGAEAEYATEPMTEGQPLQLGKVRLECLATPGHTPEGVSILVFDEALSPQQPHAVLTGDTLFIGDVGRPDLLASIGVTAKELGEMLYDSLREKLMTLPDETLVYPAHGAGSLCGKNLSSETVSTIGEQKRLNYALQPMSKAEFLEIVTAEQPEAPAYFLHDAILNKKERPTLESELARERAPLAAEEALRRLNAGEQVIDVRDAAAFAGAHLAGAVNIPLEGSYATWAGYLLDPSKPVVLIAEPGTEEEAAMRLGRIGYDFVAGHLDGGMAAFEDRPELIATVGRITAAELRDELASDEPPYVLDVRMPGEWQAGHLPGAVNVPLNHLKERMAEVPRDRDFVVQCATGYRSSIAAGILQRAGLTRFRDLVGGWKAWQAVAGLELAQ